MAACLGRACGLHARAARRPGRSPPRPRPARAQSWFGRCSRGPERQPTLVSRAKRLHPGRTEPRRSQHALGGLPENSDAGRAPPRGLDGGHVAAAAATRTLHMPRGRAPAPRHQAASGGTIKAPPARHPPSGWGSFHLRARLPRPAHRCRWRAPRRHAALFLPPLHRQPRLLDAIEATHGHGGPDAAGRVAQSRRPHCRPCGALPTHVTLENCVRRASLLSFSLRRVNRTHTTASPAPRPRPASPTTSAKVALPRPWQFPPRLAQIPPPCARGSAAAGRVATRRYGTVASTPHAPREPALPGTASPPRNPPPAAAQPQPPASPRFGVSSLLLPPEAAWSPTVHKVHIIGEDVRSKFIAHALCSVYNSVDLLSWKRTPSKYRNIETPRGGHRSGLLPSVEPNRALPRVHVKDDDSHIDELVVTGSGYAAVQALESVKHRVDDKTTVCLITDGLGVLEDVRRRLFDGSESTPRFLLGHMSHRLAFNRQYDSIKRSNDGMTMLTLPDSAPAKDADSNPAPATNQGQMDFVKSLQEVKDLHSLLTPYDNWLRFKLPAMLFDSVIEPVCVLLELPYQALRRNPDAMRMVNDLLTEIISVVDLMPEVDGSPIIRRFLHGDDVHRYLHRRIIAKKDQPGEMALRADRGLSTNIDYLNGYFLRRGHKLGLDMPMNTLMKHAVRARHSRAIEKLNSYVPVEETSVPSEMAFRYRT